MLGWIVSAVGFAAAATMNHLAKEMERQNKDRKKDQEIADLKRQVQDLSYDNDYLRIARENEKNAVSKARMTYIAEMGYCSDLRKRMAKIKDTFSESNPDYAEKIKIYEQGIKDIAEYEAEIEESYGKYKPTDMTREEIYLFYIENLKEDKDDEDDAITEAAVTEETDE